MQRKIRQLEILQKIRHDIIFLYLYAFIGIYIIGQTACTFIWTHLQPNVTIKHLLLRKLSSVEHQNGQHMLNMGLISCFSDLSRNINIEPSFYCKLLDLVQNHFWILSNLGQYMDDFRTFVFHIFGLYFIQKYKSFDQSFGDTSQFR